MLGKILLTLAVILGAYLVLRYRLRSARRPQTPQAVASSSWVARTIFNPLALGLLLVMGGGSLLWLYSDWEQGRRVVVVQVINVNTGAIVTYQARRSDVATRHFITVDGRKVILADIERMVLN